MTKIKKEYLISYLNNLLEDWNKRFINSPIHYKGMKNELIAAEMAINEIKKHIEDY